MSATREQVVAEALSWLQTPFHHCADVKGAGVDCAMLLVRVYCDLGVVPMMDPRPYKPQWFLHSSETRYLGWLAKYSRKVDEAQPGDVAVFNFGKHAAHGAIIIDDHTMLHAYVPVGRVTLEDRRALEHCRHSYWSPFP